MNVFLYHFNTYPLIPANRSYNFDDLTDQTIIQEDNAIMSFTIDQVNFFQFFSTGFT